MKERPILFSGAMVRALLDGSKTQTRRGYKNRFHPDTGCEMAACELVREAQHVVERCCPYGQPGDRLYVRETWSQPATLDPGPTVYRADYPACVPSHFTNLPTADEITWKPSIHMPRALSRIQLEIVSVRVERLNDCNEADVLAEGIAKWPLGFRVAVSGPPKHESRSFEQAADAYRWLWESINGAGSWAANPWVWVVEFKRVTP